MVLRFLRRNLVADFPCLSLRVLLSPDTLIGPGKADLLQNIQETGSIAGAGRRMRMSYKRAWYLIDTMNTYFREPIVTTAKGGKTGGGAWFDAEIRNRLDTFPP
jgi:molybdate transport system regulatory protein